MKTVAIIQAHMGSTRLPGKVLMDICGRSMLEWVVHRTKRCSALDEIVVATSILPTDDVIVAACRDMHVAVFRGSDLDVLDRFMQAARTHSADVCVRITSDCPLIDPDVSEHVIDCFRNAQPAVDYASNKIPQSYPRGLDTEVFTLGALERAWRQATKSYQRTHVTTYIYEHPQHFRLLSVTSTSDRSNWRWTVDTAEDLEFVRQIYSRVGANKAFTWLDVVSLLDGMPELLSINRAIVQKDVPLG